MKLYLVRHTTAADSASNDAQRPLTELGKNEARMVGAALAGMNARPTKVFSSPLLRARQTADIIAGQLKMAGKSETIAELSNGPSTEKLLAALAKQGREIVAVGHMPSLAEHVAVMTRATDSALFAFGNGSVACVELDPAGNRFVWLKHLPQLKELTETAS